jgi:amidase
VAPTIPHIRPPDLAYAYDADRAPLGTLVPGDEVILETSDARAGSLDDRVPGTLFELPRPPGQGNPLTGPIAVKGARPGDTLLVEILAIDVADAGWAGGHAHVNPLAEGRVSRPLGRRVAVDDGVAHFSERFAIPARPMLGCIGTAVSEAPGSGEMGRYGGNLDHPIVGIGCTVHLPVNVPDALLYIGDVHAVQGDGEISGVGLEIAATVTLRIGIAREQGLDWPWATWDGRLAVMTADEDFVVARRDATEAMVSALERAYGMEAAEALALLSVAGDLRIGQSMGRGPMTVRLEVPHWEGLGPA